MAFSMWSTLLCKWSTVLHSVRKLSIWFRSDNTHLVFSRSSHSTRLPSWDGFLLSNNTGSSVVFSYQRQYACKTTDWRGNRQTVICQTCIHKYPCENTRACFYLLSTSQKHNLIKRMLLGQHIFMRSSGVCTSCDRTSTALKDINKYENGSVPCFGPH